MVPHHEDVEGLRDVQAHVTQQGVLNWLCVQLIAVQLAICAVACAEVRWDPAEVLDPDVTGQQAIHAQHQAWMIHFLTI